MKPERVKKRMKNSGQLLQSTCQSTHKCVLISRNLCALALRTDYLGKELLLPHQKSINSTDGAKESKS